MHAGSGRFSTGLFCGDHQFTAVTGQICRGFLLQQMQQKSVQYQKVNSLCIWNQGSNCISKKQHCYKNTHVVGFKKASECYIWHDTKILHLACTELHPSCILHWLLHDGQSRQVFFSFFWSQQHDNRINNHVLHIWKAKKKICHIQAAFDMSNHYCFLNHMFLNTQIHRASLKCRRFKSLWLCHIIRIGWELKMTHWLSEESDICPLHSRQRKILENQNRIFVLF